MNRYKFKLVKWRGAPVLTGKIQRKKVNKVVREKVRKVAREKVRETLNILGERW